MAFAPELPPIAFVELPLPTVATNLKEPALPRVRNPWVIIGAVMVVHDVTAARQLSRKLARLALHDSLTDLPNRALFARPRGSWNRPRGRLHCRSKSPRLRHRP